MLDKIIASSYDPMDSYTDDEIRELCHSKDHDCATMVEHPQWGKGKPILRSHAIPDDNGYVEWYDVQFKHGIEEKVMAEDMKILYMDTHPEEKEPKNMTKLQLGQAMDDILKKAKKGPKNGQVQMVNAMRDVLSMDGHEADKEDEDEMEKKETSGT